MPQPYAFINDRQQTSVELKARLNLGKHADAKFDVLNSHIRNVVVLPGQLVIIGDDSTAACTLEESRLMQVAWEIRHDVMAEGGDALSAIHKPHLPQDVTSVYRGICGEQFHGSSAS
ncbi:hypothetical protein [Pseudomonas sp. ChxA]|uniref:hypothetical protein n=1 Tax=Pseudomonas sp. ChxA TaxID=3035473 RepID=UPI00331EC052